MTGGKQDTFMAAVEIQSVSKSFGLAPVVNNVSLRIEDGEFVVLVGPSGCGKSTTLRMVAGLEDVTSGTIVIGDKVVTHLPPRDRDIAMVFQNYALYQHMNVYDNLAFGLRNKRIPEADIREAVGRATAILGLDELLKRRPRQLSGGQQQRVALGRCLVRNPKVFLFDEPLSNLDAKLRSQMRIELKQLRSRVPTTSIYVTHDQVEAMTLGDRVVVMRDGVIQQIGRPSEIYNAPANIFVAGFIGSPAMNFARVRFATEAGTLFAIALGLKVPVPDSLRGAVARKKSGEAWLGMRPEFISVRPYAAGGQNTGIVEIVDQMGAEIVLQVRAGDGAFAVSRVDPDTPIAVGDKVMLAPNPQKLHFFDVESGGTIAAQSEMAQGAP
jgi:multiple sugar transport system ATP-binding protein